jgi:predicted nucleic acid-binding protein
VAQVFIDTSGWANFFVRPQAQHDLADTLLHEMRGTGRAVTTNYVLAELVALMISPLRLPHALRQEVSNARRGADWVDIVHVDEQLDRRSWQFMAQHRDKDFSLVDCSSFVVMRERSITTALTTNHHFEQAGVRPTAQASLISICANQRPVR